MPSESMWWNPRTKSWSLRTKEQEKQRREVRARTEAANWALQQQLIAHAKILAEFANLEPKGIRKFRADYSGFFPEQWWDYRPTAYDGTPSPKQQWQITQKYLRDAWMFQFDIGTPLFDYIHLLISVFNPDDVFLTKSYRPPFPKGIEIGDDYPYHRAVKWLTGQGGWRAKTCSFCDRRFIAEHPNGRFCSFGVSIDGNNTSCSWAYRKGYKNAWWAVHSHSVNEERRKQYKSRKRKAEVTPRGTKRP